MSTIAPVNFTLNGITYEDVTLSVSTYVYSGDTAVQLITEGWEPLATVTVNLEAYGFVPRPGNIFVKDWSENEGMAAELHRLGWATFTGRRYPVGGLGAEAIEMTPTGDLRAMIDAHMEQSN